MICSFDALSYSNNSLNHLFVLLKKNKRKRDYSSMRITYRGTEEETAQSSRYIRKVIDVDTLLISLCHLEHHPQFGQIYTVPSCQCQIIKKTKWLTKQSGRGHYTSRIDMEFVSGLSDYAGLMKERGMRCIYCQSVRLPSCC